MANAATRAAANSGVKKERKAPVRKAPAAKDFPSRIAWLEAMMAYEKAEAEKTNAAKLVRLDKRIASAEAARDEAAAKVDALKAERNRLMPDETAAEPGPGHGIAEEAGLEGQTLQS